ncbi:formylglycine-generating enzyme family protein [Marichromatium bheemlicum]|uniref:SUMF1/EgtB/PvdO family nonheme iron enzyme n=1 Tax=Marichromatium bheemlicum TaxID=365339 RepID=A0ABX1I9Z7_9GAMM|nr:formylglycine-generating enzyme family protein [Marichromatium bheemlicum]NKN33869.1 SUMF1/EgtB/PvdO family nonheme iron enzyme [Marichromatium bheemlicum]
MSEPTEESGAGEARGLRNSLEQMREQAAREIERLNRRLAAREQAVEESIASETERLALQQELTLLRQTLSVKEQALGRITDECQRLEDQLEDRNLAFDGLQQAFEQRDSSLRQTQLELERMRREMAWLQKRAYGAASPPPPPPPPPPVSPSPTAAATAPPTPPPPPPRVPAGPAPTLPPELQGYSRRPREGRLVIGLVLLVLALVSFAVFLPQLRYWFSGMSFSDQPAELIWAEPPRSLKAPPPERRVAPVEEPAPLATEVPRAAQMPLLRRDRLSDGSFGPELVELPGGSFRMGYNSLARTDYMPAHQVTLRPFLIGAYEVTFAEYDRFAQATGRRLPDDQGWGRGTRPVVDVSWEDARAYAAWLSRESGYHYRLPSEAEWEYAARAGGRGSYWWGFGKEPGRAVCFDCGSRWDRRSTAPVGSLQPSPFGLFDTAGNAMEWVLDCYVAGYQGAPNNGRPRLDGGCVERVARGGAFNQPATAMRTYARQHFAPETQLNMLGFRIVRDL